MTAMCFLALGCKSEMTSKVSKTKLPSASHSEIASDGSVLVATVDMKDTGNALKCLSLAKIGASVSCGRGVCGIRVMARDAKMVEAVLFVDSKLNHYKIRLISDK